MDTDILLRAEGLSRHFGDLLAVDDVSFTVRKGDVLGFLGPNGAGKTTTMRIISGNLAPSTGSVSVANHDLLEDPRAAKASIGYLPEQPPVYRELTVTEYLDYCAALNRIPRGARRGARDTALERCGLTDVRQRVIGNLSKGYQQRVGIAQAIIHQPLLVVLDEPTVGLDPIQIREIRSLIRELGTQHGVILSTHILPEVQAICDHVQIIHQGRLVLRDNIGGLARRMQSTALQVAFRHAPEPAALERIAGVRSVDAQDGGRVRLYCEPEQNPADELVRRSVENDWGLYELIPEQASLEDIFLQLTTEEAAGGEQAA